MIKAPDRQGQRGLTLVHAAEGVAEAVRVALDASRTATLLVEEHVPGQRGDRERLLVRRALLPAHGDRPIDRAVAGFRRRSDARLAERARPGRDRCRRRGGGRRGGGGRDRERAELHAGARRTGRPARRRARGAARRWARRRALPRGARGRPERRGALRGARRGDPGHEPRARGARRRACVRFLVPPPGELREVHGLEEAFAQEGIRGIRIYRRPGHRFEEFRRGPTGREQSWPWARAASRRSSALPRAEATIRFETDVEALV